MTDVLPDPFNTEAQRRLRDALTRMHEYRAIRTRVEHGTIIVEPVPIAEMYKLEPTDD